MLLTSREQRKSLLTIYTFCRMTDDIADEANDMKQLSEWKISVNKALEGSPEGYVLTELSRVIKLYNINAEWFRELLLGVELDLKKSSFPSLDQLEEYAYKVASTVGLMVISVLGLHDKRSRDYAVHVGLALQLTNIVRDEKKDRASGRNYLPENVWNGEEAERSNAFKVLSLRAWEHHTKADELFDQIAFKRELFPARAMQNIYRELLTKIETHKPGSPKRASLTPYEKTSAIVKSWIQTLRS